MDIFAITSNFQQNVSLWKIQLDKLQGISYEQSLSNYIQIFPFSANQWNSYVKCIQQRQGIDKALLIWQKGLLINGHNQALWRMYIKWIQKNIKEKLLDCLQRSLQYCDWQDEMQQIYKLYLTNEKRVQKIYNIYKSNLLRVNSNLDDINNKFNEWLIKLDNEQVNKIWRQDHKQALVDNQRGRQIIKQEINNHYIKSQAIFNQRKQFSKIYQSNYNHQYMRQYLLLVIRQNYHSFDVLHQFEKALNIFTFQPQIWSFYYNHFQPQYLLHKSRSLQKFILNFSPNIAHIWAQLQEKQSKIQKSREIYLQLQKYHSNLQTFQRHIYMQIRTKQHYNAKCLYQTAIRIFADIPTILSQLVIQFAQFAKKQLRDVQFGKKILRIHNQNQIFKPKLFIGHIEYLTKIDVKQGTKQFKELGSQIMQTIKKGLSRAKENLSQKQYQSIFKVVKYKIRGFFTTIYSLKFNQRKLTQIQNQKQRKVTLQQPLCHKRK